MEFGFNINKFFPDSITKLTGRRAQSDSRYGAELAFTIDTVGEASRLAQGLNRPVTTARTFFGSDQTLYIMTNPKENNGKGLVLGLLKIGPKKLFLLNRAGVQNELNPICVLDFYIHESCQRMGLGKMLFDHFLNEEKFSVRKLAIDRPSDKFLGFLRKHYGLANMIPQVNNFVIFEGFFDNSSNNSGYQENQSFNRWNSMFDVNNLDQYRGRSFNHHNQSSISMTPQPVNSCGRTMASVSSSDLWRAASMADVSMRSSAVQGGMGMQATHLHPSSPAQRAGENVSKFSHHRLW